MPVEYETARPRFFGVFRPAPRPHAGVAARSATRPGTPSSPSPCTSTTRVELSACAASWTALLAQRAEVPACWEKRCTLTTRKGPNRPARSWQSWTGSVSGEGGGDGANSRSRDGADSARTAPGAADPDRDAARPRPSRSRSRARRPSPSRCLSRRPGAIGATGPRARSRADAQPEPAAERRSNPLAGRDVRPTAEVSSRCAFADSLPLARALAGRRRRPRERRRREPEAGGRRTAPAGAGEDRLGAAARAHARRPRSPRSTPRSADSRLAGRRRLRAARAARARPRSCTRRSSTRLNELFRLQTSRYHFYRSEYSALIDRLGNRLVDLYETGRAQLARGAVLLPRASTDLIDAGAGASTRSTRRTSRSPDRSAPPGNACACSASTRSASARSSPPELRTIAVRTNQVRALRDQLLASENRLAAARAYQARARSQDVKESKPEFLHEAAGLQQASADLAAQIRSAQSTYSYSAPGDTTPSAAGFIWPVNGPVTSAFGWRWGRMHEGIDIGVGYGTPIHAAAVGPRRLRRLDVAATGTSSRSTTAAGSRPPTATSRASPSASARSSRRARRSATSAAPATASARTCTSRCGSTARRSIRSATC